MINQKQQIRMPEGRNGTEVSLLMKKIGIGYENYKEFINQDMYYIDKTMLIRDIVEQGGKVMLFTRPRRFGKTLALSMLRTFFEKEYDYDGNVVDSSRWIKIFRMEKQPARFFAF